MQESKSDSPIVFQIDGNSAKMRLETPAPMLRFYSSDFENETLTKTAVEREIQITRIKERVIPSLISALRDMVVPFDHSAYFRIQGDSIEPFSIHLLSVREEICMRQTQM